MSNVFHWSYGRHDAPVLLCLHGIGSCADAFEPQRPLAERLDMRVVAWDAPGYRYSADPDTAPGIDGWADAAAALIEAVSGGPAVVLGVSWGGVTATRLVLRRPDLVSALTLADSSAGAGTKPEQAAAMRARAADFVDLGPEGFAAARAQRLVSPEASDEMRAQVAEMMVPSIRMPCYQWACDSMAESNHYPKLERITAPTLVVVGEHDEVTPPRSSQRLAEGIAGACYAEIPGAGHLANQERPEAFNDVVADFVESLAG
ncbi:alpha/beta fold hydrolase [Candidatus Poriferisodalis sp.]|uniref:alpha/beta fold hydrolase n=1 Tax=Candidatus Poriferisodalis sp. TaxID=3101277 RepID=UPI003B0233AB